MTVGTGAAAPQHHLPKTRLASYSAFFNKRLYPEQHADPEEDADTMFVSETAIPLPDVEPKVFDQFVNFMSHPDHCKFPNALFFTKTYLLALKLQAEDFTNHIIDKCRIARQSIQSDLPSMLLLIQKLAELGTLESDKFATYLVRQLAYDMSNDGFDIVESDENKDAIQELEEYRFFNRSLRQELGRIRREVSTHALDEIKMENVGKVVKMEHPRKRKWAGFAKKDKKGFFITGIVLDPAYGQDCASYHTHTDPTQRCPIEISDDEDD